MVQPPVTQAQPTLLVKQPMAPHAVMTTTPTFQGLDAEGEGVEEGERGGVDGKEADAESDDALVDETTQRKFVMSFFAADAPYDHSAPPSPPITPKPEQRKSGQRAWAANVLRVLATLATLLLFSLLLLDWARGEAHTSLSHAGPNGSRWVDGCPVGWSAAPGGQYL